ncbi:hypothetical protein VHUM_03047 [Vanrija humicola]|uniref:DUF1996 domain-containing protein n=1 Tax=Vanrija humicola TaxID=5417 RepID=A0A7D8Z473_VANHU|nr:hypothetical protein VHUM_03047 [Vanrija humicola]
MLALLFLLLSLAPATLASWAVADPPSPVRRDLGHGLPARHFRRQGGGQPLWVLGTQHPIAVTRIDPIVDPGKVGGHVHSIFGASNFRSTLLEPGEQQKAVCTNTKIQADKSNYWFPLMYFHNANGSYSAVDHSSRIYYFGTNNGAKMHAFPPGLRMIAGLATKRAPWDIRAQGHSLDVYFDSASNVPDIIMKFLPNSTTHTSPPKTIDLALTFPSCGWANQSLDSDDHFSHMTWPIRVNNDGTTDIDPRGSICPDTHPIKYPIIHSEMLYEVDQAMQDQWGKTGRSEFVLSNGDTTGLTYHGDFVSGWDVDVMTQALATCQVGDEIHNCPAFSKFDQWEKDKCLLEGEIVDEDVGYFRPLDKLPGCNALWGWDGPDTKPTECSGPNPGFVAPNFQYVSIRGFNTPRFPYVVPGLDTSKFNLSDPNGLHTSTGIQPSRKIHPVLLPRSTNITYFGVTTQIAHSTQDEVNANASK